MAADLAGVKANAVLEHRLALCGKMRIQRHQSTAHLKGRPKRTRRVIMTAYQGAEDGIYFVTHKT